MIYTNKIWLVNAALAVISVFIGLKTFDLWFGDPFEAENVKKKTAQKAQEKRVALKTRIKPEASYDSVVRDNLFSHHRKEVSEPEEKKSEPVVESEPVPEPVIEIIPEVEELKVENKEVAIYGVMIMDEFTGALVNNFAEENPVKKQKWVKKGEEIGDLKLEDVKKDRAIFSKISEGKKEKYAVLLFTKKKQDEELVTKKKETSKAKPKVFTTAQEKKSNTKAANSGSDVATDDEYETIQTPFGSFKRKKRK